MREKAVARRPGYYWAERNGDGGVNEMVDYGIKAVRRGRFDAIKFDCFSQSESELVKRLMAEQAPEIPFMTTYIAPRPTGGAE